MAKARVRCPWHNEKTASLVRRKSDYYCYGSCAKAYTLEEVSQKGIALDYEEDDQCAENIEEKFTYITQLPYCEIRGLKFPADFGGYYVCWPDNKFYKYRRFEPGDGPKYLAPKGHSIPLFWARKTGAKTLGIIEGEVNCKSVAKVMETWDACSPGSATKFNANILNKHLTEFKNYSNVVVIVDRDAAGTKALIETRAAFLYKLPFTRYIQLEKDCNELLIEGPEILRKALCGENS